MRRIFSWLLSVAWLVGCSESSSTPAGAGGATAPTTTAGGSTGVAGSASGGAGGAGGSASGGAGGAGGSASGGGGVEDPGTMSSDARLYTADGTEFVIDEIGEALVHAASGGGVDALIYYVHGRGCSDGGEPAKSLAGAMPEMEAGYAARVVMFNWPGSGVGCPVGFPEAEARASGPAFAHTLRRLAYFEWQDPEAFAGHTLTLITHSMGNLVLEQATVDDDSPLPSALFDTMMLGSAAVAADGHASWLAQVGYAGALYVSGNANDAMLLGASVLVGARLGQGVDGVGLASNAVYVDFTASGVNHDYYLPTSQNGEHMVAFWATVMGGQPFDFADAEGIASVESRDGTHVYHFDGQ